MWVIFQVRKLLSLQLSCSILVFCCWYCFASVGHIPLKEILCWWFSKLLLLFAFFLDFLEFVLHSNYLFCAYCDIVWIFFLLILLKFLPMTGRKGRPGEFFCLGRGRRHNTQVCSWLQQTQTHCARLQETQHDNLMPQQHHDTYAINSTTRPSVDYAKDWMDQIN